MPTCEPSSSRSSSPGSCAQPERSSVIVVAFMDVAIVAPCPIPYTIGGAENLCRWLQDYINDHTEHQAETIKLPTREFGFWSLIDAYGRFAELDLSGFDAVVSMKFPAWMIQHRNHTLL